MKNLGKVIKWGPVLLLAMGLIFAGCTGSSSSDDSAIPAKASPTGARYVYKFSVDPQAGKLDIEPVVMGSALSTTHFGGTVDVSTGTCTWDGGTGQLSCPITVKNLTAGLYLSRIRTWEYSCADTGCNQSATATLNTWDYGTGALIDSDNTGMCIVEDGTWKHRDTIGPFNLKCPTYLYQTGYTDTLQYLHPECGAITQTWIFGNENNAYQFYTALVDTAAGSTLGPQFGMFPEDVFQDSRYNSEYSTFVLRAYHLDSTWCTDGQGCKTGSTTAYYRPYSKFGCFGENQVTTMDGYKLGAPQCSTPIADGETLAPGQFFAVAAGFEWPDRIENQNHGMRCKMTVTNALGPCNATGLSCYEWMNDTMMVYAFDGSIIEPIDATTVTAGGSVLTVDSQWEVYYGDKKPYADTNDGNNGAPLCDPGSMAPHNYIFWYRMGPDLNFAFKTATYNTANCIVSVRENVARTWADPRPIATNGAIPDYRANTGNMGAYGWTGLAEIYVNEGNNRCDFRDLPQDAEVDYWAQLNYFRVKPTAPAGSGTIIKVEPNAGNTLVKWFHSNCTRDGGMLGDDLTGTWNWPCTGAPCEGTGSGTSTLLYDIKDPRTIIYDSQETSNPNMPGGFNSHAGHGKQVINEHICVGP